jgi:hypothetical protein
VYYERYLEQKLRLENEIKVKTIKEQIKLNTTRNRILEKYNCSYIDVSKNTVEARILENKDARCYSINKIIVSENQLVQIGTGVVSEQNPMTWPVNPIQ